MVMKLTIRVPSDAITAIKEEIKDQGFEPPSEDELREALEIHLEESFSYEMQTQSESRFIFAEWLISNWELKEIKKYEEEK